MDEHEVVQEVDVDPTPSRRGWYLAVLGIVAVGALAVGVIAGPNEESSSNGPAAIEEPAPDAAEDPAGYAAPDDGLDSIGLPVTVTPVTGLTDGQPVQVTSTGFPAGSQVGLIQCTSQSITLGQSACDMSTLVYAAVADDGTVDTTFFVRRHLYVGGTPVDCGTGNVDPATWVSAQTASEDQFTCILGVGSLMNYDVSGNSAIAFEGAVFGGQRPALPDITTTTYPEVRDCSERPVDVYDDFCMHTGPDPYSTDTTMYAGGEDELQGIVPTTSTLG